MNACDNYPLGVTGAEPYFNVLDELPLACYDCGVILGEDAACPETPNLCRACHQCDDTCIAFVRCSQCGVLTRNYVIYPSTGPRCVEYFACARRMDETACRRCARCHECDDESGVCRKGKDGAV